MLSFLSLLRLQLLLDVPLYQLQLALIQFLYEGEHGAEEVFISVRILSLHRHGRLVVGVVD